MKDDDYEAALIQYDAQRVLDQHFREKCPDLAAMYEQTRERVDRMTECFRKALTETSAREIVPYASRVYLEILEVTQMWGAMRLARMKFEMTATPPIAVRVDERFTRYCGMTCIGGSEKKGCKCEGPLDCEFKDDPIVANRLSKIGKRAS